MFLWLRLVAKRLKSLYKVFRDCKLKIPTINVNDSVTPSSTTIMAAASRSSTISSPQPMSCSLLFLALEMSARVAPSLRSYGARVLITEIDPINALQAAMAGYEVTIMEPRQRLRHHHW
ncbi:hypothetical protein K438DRAFT_1863396 [Mycena galopus ATCC 62051]|nr:hypothetical protein K438DRAFT_1863396 [Mycena galopus ATCC 62051]